MPVEAHAPDIAQTVSPDLGTHPFGICIERISFWIALLILSHKRIILGDAVRKLARAGIDVDAQDFGQKMMAALADVVGIVGQAAIAHANVKKTIRAEDQGAAIMVPIGMGHLH